MLLTDEKHVTNRQTSALTMDSDATLEMMTWVVSEYTYSVVCVDAEREVHQPTI
jgi:hypothetical protein